ncbi:MAG: 7-cyano-7-deazaguanine synthase QueC [Bacteroidetes bacterium]|nr:7-cyano-7-deazaguanine synthase QueC [Bacteroidota bacterium]
MAPKAVVLFSGGLDSTTVLYLARSKGYDVHAISFRYGQRHSRELDVAEKTIHKLNISNHQIISIDISAWGGSALTDTSINVPDYRADHKDIPVTYVPARNMIFLSIATSYAEAIGAYDIFTGISQVDYSGYVDCRKEFIDAMQAAINKGTVCAVEDNKPIRIHAPFMYKNKDQEITLGIRLGVDYGLTWSCYRGDDKPCGTCDSCQLRLQAFEKAGYPDPLEYENKI